MSTVEIKAIITEGGDLKLIGSDEDDDDAEVGTNGHGSGNEFLDILWACTGGDIEVVWGDVHELVANASAGEEGLVACVVEFLND